MARENSIPSTIGMKKWSSRSVVVTEDSSENKIRQVFWVGGGEVYLQGHRIRQGWPRAQPPGSLETHFSSNGCGHGLDWGVFVDVGGICVGLPLR